MNLVWKYLSFNTLYVVGSNKKHSYFNNKTRKVSIHYMLLVQCFIAQDAELAKLVSIHYMLLVQFRKSRSLKWVKNVSIHYMLLVQQSLSCRVGCWVSCFNTLYVVGSKILCKMEHLLDLCFNTLYVVGSNLCYPPKIRIYVVSIHYMLLVQESKYGKIPRGHCGFNTLYVVGSRIEGWAYLKGNTSFNTLYVVGSKK